MNVPGGNILMFRPSPFHRSNYGESMHELYHCGEGTPEMFEDGVVLRLKVLDSSEWRGGSQWASGREREKQRPQQRLD
jgi:hypothetical protein